MKKILLVDDDEDILNATQCLLEYEGFEIFTAKDGLEATTIYQQQKPSLTFMDVCMPNMDGFEAFEKIRTMDKNAKIILLSGFEYDQEKITDAKNKGLCCFHNKPIGLAKFKELIIRFG